MPLFEELSPSFVGSFLAGWRQCLVHRGRLGCQDNAVPLFGFCWVGLGKEPSGQHGRGGLGHRTVDCGGVLEGVGVATVLLVVGLAVDQ